MFMKAQQLSAKSDILTELQVTQNKQLTMTRVGRVQTKKDSKNEGRSDYVYENTRACDTMSLATLRF